VSENRPLYGAIRNPDQLIKAALRRRTERFNHCFPRGISLGDIDSFVEVNKRFLFLEWKLNDQVLPTGQRYALERLAAQPNTTVWIIWTDEDGTITHGRDMGALVSRRGQITEERVATAIQEWVAGTWVSPAANANTVGGR
jgi:hypothetical protein